MIETSKTTIQTIESKHNAIIDSCLITSLRRTPTPFDYSVTELIVKTKFLVVKYKGQIIRKLERWE